MLMSVQEYRAQFTPASRPDPRTVRRWLERGELVGIRRGRRWYVDVEADPVQTRVQALVDRVMGGST